MDLPDRRLAAVAAIAFVALAAAHTWPLATAPGTLSRNDNADAMLNEWIVAWVAHALPSAPRHLFDANVFHPEPNTLAFSEHLFVPAVLAAPAIWMGASPVLAYNLLVLAGLALTGWSAWLVVRRWTGDPAAALAAGSIAAFNAHTLTRLPHVQALHLEFLPLALLALDRLIERPSVSTAIRLAGWFALQALTSNYLLVFTVVALVVATLVRIREWWPHARRFLGLAAVAGVLGALVVTPFLLPYVHARQAQGLSRSLDEVALYSAGWRDYLSTAGRAHYALWSARFMHDTTALFPGMVATALVILAATLGRPEGRPLRAGTTAPTRYAGADPQVGPQLQVGPHGSAGPRLARARTRMLAAIALVAVALSFGPALPGYALLYRVFPLLQGIRGAARFGELALLALALLAGFGAAAIRARVGGRAGLVLIVAATIVANVEALRAPLELTAFRGVPAVYDNLAREPGAIVAEFPMPAPEAFQVNAAYQLNSTRHWRPLVNGYSGFVPASYVEHYRALRVLPEPPAIDVLRRLGVTHIVVHEAAFVELKGQAVYDAVLRSDALESMVVAEGVRIMRVRR